MRRRSSFGGEEFALVALLKDCAKKKDVHRGSALHHDVLKRGLVEKSPHLASALIHMYSKCGMPWRGQEVLESLLVPDVVAWNALICGYAQLGQGHEAMKCFEQMRRKGLSPNAVTFICILKACGGVGDIGAGQKIHDEIVSGGASLLKENAKLGNALVDMYARCGFLSKARELMEELPSQTVGSWNSLISGCTNRGQCYEAFDCSEQMQCEGLLPDAITFICVLKACSNAKNIERGKQIHGSIRSRNLVAENVTTLGTALVDMYAKCGMPATAQRVLEELPERNVISWSTLIAGYVHEGRGEEALKCYERMLSEGLAPDAIALSCILKACGNARAVDKGKEIHDRIAREGLLGKDIVLGTALVDMYAKCGEMERARRVLLEELRSRDVISWNALIAGYVQSGKNQEALDCFDRLRQSEGFSPDMVTYLSALKACGNAGALEKGERIHGEIERSYRGFLERDSVLGNALLDMYAKCGALAKAERLLEELPCRSGASWNAMISGYAELGRSREALNCLERMRSEGLAPDAIAFACALKACASSGAIAEGEKVHGMMVSGGGLELEKELAAGTALLDMYAKCGELAKAHEVFEGLEARNVISWSALISGHAQRGQCREAVACYERMRIEGLSPNAVTFGCLLKACGSSGAIGSGERIHEEISERGLLEKEMVLGNALLDMYAKCGELKRARELLLVELPNRDIVSWNTLIAAHADRGHGNEALECFERMRGAGFRPNRVTLVCALKACSSAGAMAKGKQIHRLIARFTGLDLLEEKDGILVVGTALVDMYVKCGELAEAAEVLRELPMRSVISWNSLIAGYAQQGRGREALDCLEQMQREGLSPDDVTFLCILSACSHGAMVGEASTVFRNMERIYGISPDVEHCTCMVSLLAHAGLFREAVSVIMMGLETVPDDHASDLWLALLGACRKWGNSDLALLAFDQSSTTAR